MTVKPMFRLILFGILISQSVAPLSAAAALDEGQSAAVIRGTNFLTGVKLDLTHDLGKRVILLDFGSIYCSSCLVTVPNLIMLRKKYPAEDLVIYNIYLDVYNTQRTKKFLKDLDKNSQLHLLIDENLTISREYGIETLPTTIIIDRSGIIRRRSVGYTESEEKEINEVIAKLVKEHLATKVLRPGAKGEDALTIFSPESFTKTVQDKIYVVGHLAGSDAKNVSIRLNNLPARTVVTKNNVFHFQTPLSLAMNFIEIKGQVRQGKVQNQSLVVFRETRMGEDIKSDLARYRFHRDDEKKPCTKCHPLNVSLPEQTTQERNDVCGKCHTSFETKIYTHDPLSDGGCLLCHDSRSFPDKYELRGEGAEQCFTCHDTMGETLKKLPFTHGPVAAGVCTACHDAHASNERFLLLKKEELLCFGCHQEMLRELANPVIHEPVRNGNCTVCHLPHAGKESMFLVKPRERLCNSCHDLVKSYHTHKVGVAVKTALWPPNLVTKEGTTSCYTCHTHHSSKLPKLLRGPMGECSPGCHAANAPTQPTGK